MAMPDDSSGYLEAIAEIPKGQLSERQQRIAAGLAMIRDGSSIREASHLTNIPYSTLYDHKRGLTETDHEKAFQKGERALVDGLLAIATLASEKVFERVEADSMRDGDLIKAQGVAIDKIALKRGWSKGQQANGDDHGMTTLARLLSGKKLTIEDADPVKQAIEVDAITSTDDAE